MCVYVVWGTFLLLFFYACVYVYVFGKNLDNWTNLIKTPLNKGPEEGHLSKKCPRKSPKPPFLSNFWVEVSKFFSDFCLFFRQL